MGNQLILKALEHERDNSLKMLDELLEHFQHHISEQRYFAAADYAGALQQLLNNLQELENILQFPEDYLQE